MLIDSQLADNRAQPATQGTNPGIIGQLSARLSIVAGLQAMQLGPNRLRQIIRHIFVRTCRARRRTNSRTITFKQIAPRTFVAALACDHETEVVGMQSVKETVHRGSIWRSLMFQKILLG